MLESSDKTWSIGEGNDKSHFATSAFMPWEPQEQYKKGKDMTLKVELPRSVGTQYATGEKQINISEDEEAKPKKKQQPVVAVSGGEIEVQC